MPARARLQEWSKDSPLVTHAHDAAHELSTQTKKSLKSLDGKAREAREQMRNGEWPRLVLMAERRVFWLVELLQGKVGSNSHPLHPTLIHLPLAFLMASLSLDVLALITPSLPVAVLARMPFRESIINSWAYHLAGAGLIFSLPATTSGLAELYAMVRSRVMENGWGRMAGDVWSGEDSKVVATLVHAGTMDLVIALVSYTFLERRLSMRLIPEILNTYSAKTSHLYLSACALVVLSYGGYKGGDLVYAKGMGVQRQGSAVASS